jgi:hypothetical protein
VLATVAATAIAAGFLKQAQPVLPAPAATAFLVAFATQVTIRMRVLAVALRARLVHIRHRRGHVVALRALQAGSTAIKQAQAPTIAFVPVLDIMWHPLDRALKLQYLPVTTTLEVAIQGTLHAILESISLLLA